MDVEKMNGETCTVCGRRFKRYTDLAFHIVAGCKGKKKEGIR